MSLAGTKVLLDTLPSRVVMCFGLGTAIRLLPSPALHATTELLTP